MSRTWLVICALAALAGTLAACHEPSARNASDGASAAAEADKNPVTRAEDIDKSGAGPLADAWVAPTMITSEKTLDENARYSLYVRDAEVKDILLGFGRKSPYNFVISPDVKGQVTVDLKDVSLEQALTAVLTPGNLTYRKDGDIIWVEAPGASPEMFQLDYVITQRTGSRSITNTNIGVDNTTSNTNTNTTAGTSTIGSAGGTDSVSSNETSDIFGSLENDLKLLMSDKGKMSINREAGLVTVVDYRENLRRINEYLSKVMEQMHRQVAIEAKVLEVNLSKSREYGIDWTAVFGDFSATLTDRTSDRVLTATLTTKDITSIIKAISQNDKTVIKTSPRVLAMNNQSALIMLGEQEVYFETVDERDEQTGKIIRTSTYPRSVTIGVSLSVVPHINREGIITMDVHPRVTEKVGEKKAPDGTTVPELSIREISTVARLRDGETMVIGGLITERKIDSTTGAPLVSTIPVVGPALFSTRTSESRKIELVIFLTPRIVRTK